MAAKSLHAQTHKLKRQVTICEDSVSIPDSVLFSRQCSMAGSAAGSISANLNRGSSNLHMPSRSPNGSLSPRSPVSGIGGGGAGVSGANGGLPSIHVPSPDPDPVAADEDADPEDDEVEDAEHVSPWLPRQESSFTVDEINR